MNAEPQFIPLAEQWQQYKLQRMQSVSEWTIRTHEFGLKRFDEYLQHPATIADLTDEAVSGFVSWRRLTVSPATVNRDLVVILSLWRWLHQQRLVECWPSVQLCRLTTLRSGEGQQ